jgi:hypothetical protein
MVWPVRVVPLGSLAIGTAISTQLGQQVVTTVVRASYALADAGMARLLAPVALTVDEVRRFALRAGDVVDRTAELADRLPQHEAVARVYDASGEPHTVEMHREGCVIDHNGERCHRTWRCDWIVANRGAIDGLVIAAALKPSGAEVAWPPDRDELESLARLAHTSALKDLSATVGVTPEPDLFGTMVTSPTPKRAAPATPFAPSTVRDSARSNEPIPGAPWSPVAAPQVDPTIDLSSTVALGNVATAVPDDVADLEAAAEDRAARERARREQEAKARREAADRREQERQTFEREQRAAEMRESARRQEDEQKQHERAARIKTGMYGVFDKRSDRDR